MKLRLATYNVENLFRRAAILNLRDSAKIDELLDKVRQLQRLLSREQYDQALKDEVRRDLAIHHLADGRLSIEAVAAQLGFTDASSFHRAFRKWTGTAPGAWRAG